MGRHTQLYANEAPENLRGFTLFVYLVETEEISAHYKQIRKEGYTQRTSISLLSPPLREKQKPLLTFWCIFFQTVFCPYKYS